MIWGLSLWFTFPIEMKYFVPEIKPNPPLACIQLCCMHTSPGIWVVFFFIGILPSLKINSTFHLKLASFLSFPSSPISRCPHTMYLQLLENGHLGIFQLRKIILKYLRPGDPRKSFGGFPKPFEILCWIGVMGRGIKAFIIFSNSEGLLVLTAAWRAKGDTLPVVPGHIGWCGIETCLSFTQASAAESQ